MADNPQPHTSSKKKSRSPAYPFIPLKEAIECAKKMYDKEGKHGARFEVVAGHWGYKVTSSGAMQTVAALRQFGLVSFEGGVAETRVIKLTELAIRILLDEREPEKAQAIREAALKPKLYADLWQKYGHEPPSDATIASYLKIDLHFNPPVVNGVIKDYKDTVAFAKPDLSATLPGSDQDEEGDEEPLDEPLVNPPAPAQKGTKPEQKTPMLAGSSREVEVLRSAVAGGRTVRVLFSGPPPTRAEISFLAALLDLTKNQYPETISPDTSPDPQE